LSNKRVLLIDKRGLLINKGILIYILSFKSIIVRNLKIGCTPARKIDFKVILIYSLSFIKRVGYKTKDLIKFK
jgi:hypothetical protein